MNDKFWSIQQRDFDGQAGTYQDWNQIDGSVRSYDHALGKAEILNDHCKYFDESEVRIVEQTNYGERVVWESGKQEQAS